MYYICVFLYVSLLRRETNGGAVNCHQRCELRPAQLRNAPIFRAQRISRMIDKAFFLLARRKRRRAPL